MISTLYGPFRHWSDSGSVYILSDSHFDDEDCNVMRLDWIMPEEHLSVINGIVIKNDTCIIEKECSMILKKRFGYSFLMYIGQFAGI